MPTNKGITTTCLFCAYHGRSDHVKRHIIKQHGGMIASDTIRLVGRVAVVVSVPYADHPEIKHYRKGACLDCGTAVSKHRDDKNHLAITCFQGHSCKAKQQRERTAERVVTPKAAVAPTVPMAAAAKKDDTDSIDVDEVIEEDYQLFFDQIITAIDATGLSEKQKQVLVNLLENNRVEDDDKTDYRSSIMGFIKDLLPTE